MCGRETSLDYVIETSVEPRQPYVAVRATVRMAEIGQRMGPLFGELFGWLGRKGIEPAGAPWARYLTVGADEVELEIGAPLAAEIAGEDGMIAGVRPACEVAATIYMGPYEQIGPAYQAIAAWLSENGRLNAGAMWEIYETDPEQEPDPAKWRTRIVYPLAPP